MKRTASLIAIICQLAIVGLFCMTLFNDDVKIEKYVSTVHNENLDKIASSVSILFEEEKKNEIDANIEDLTLRDLPTINEIKEEVKKPVEEKTEEVVSTPLYSIDASKYINNEKLGFKVTEGNKQYNLSDYEFNVVVAVVAGEFDKNLNDALAVVSVILNRCDLSNWSWAGKNPYNQVIAANQFEVYFTDIYSISYLRYMPNGDLYGKSKYQTAKQAVYDGLNGIRNNKYTGFRAHGTGYSNNSIVSGGNEYGYEGN